MGSSQRMVFHCHFHHEQTPLEDQARRHILSMWPWLQNVWSPGSNIWATRQTVIQKIDRGWNTHKSVTKKSLVDVVDVKKLRLINLIYKILAKLLAEDWKTLFHTLYWIPNFIYKPKTNSFEPRWRSWIDVFPSQLIHST